MRTTISLTVIATLALTSGIVLAVDPPGLMNYQGVLRNADDEPLDGSHDMIFRFYDDPDPAGPENEIFVDEHLASGTGAVTVTGGLFDVLLGSGDFYDGSGPGDHPHIFYVFGLHETVYLEVQVGAERLEPRMQVVSAPYAIHAVLLGGYTPSEFLNTTSEEQQKNGTLVIDSSGQTDTTALTTRGGVTGGKFSNTQYSGNADVGTWDVGVSATGDYSGGEFANHAHGSHAWLANASYGIDGRGSGAGGYFTTSGGTGYAWVGYFDEGISAHGDVQGGYFEDNQGTSNAHIAYGDRGVEALGSEAGGYFKDLNGPGEAFVGYSDLFGTSYGVWANGGDSVDSSVGVSAFGGYAGGFFSQPDYGAFAHLGFRQSTTGELYGIWAEGAEAGGRFVDRDGGTGEAYIANDDRGMWGAGEFAGGTFSDTFPHTDVFADVARTVVIDPGPPAIEEYHKILGNGAMSFVQNHPEAPDRVVVYTAPEGDEVATYTRGTARLEAGEARIPLGSTFRWVTNPDVGLTAHLTPHGDCLGLYVESLNSDELVIRELGGGASDVRFDYLVMGLRIGYEQAAVVQAKDREAPIPSSGVGAEYYTRALDPALHTPLQRFRQMEADVRGVAIDEIDLSGAMALRESITASAWQRIGMRPEGAGTEAGDMPSQPVYSKEEAGIAAQESDDRETAIVSPGLVAQDAGESSPRDGPAGLGNGLLFPVSRQVGVGDLLALDPERSGMLVPAATPHDTAVAGIAVGDAVAADGELRVELAATNYAVLKVDAGYGEIRPGDLLTSSFTPGHAMRAMEALPGTIVGKALEPLDAGTGSIRVLVMPR